jgi:hypothetical protein
VTNRRSPASPNEPQARTEDVLDLVDRRVAGRSTASTIDAAVDRIVARLGDVSEFTDAQVRQIAAIALIAMSVDDADRQRRDDTARENRRRLRRLGRD